MWNLTHFISSIRSDEVRWLAAAVAIAAVLGATIALGSFLASGPDLMAVLVVLMFWALLVGLMTRVITLLNSGLSPYLLGSGICCFLALLLGITTQASMAQTFLIVALGATAIILFVRSRLA